MAYTRVHILCVYYREKYNVNASRLNTSTVRESGMAWDVYPLHRGECLCMEGTEPRSLSYGAAGGRAEVGAIMRVYRRTTAANFLQALTAVDEVGSSGAHAVLCESDSMAEQEKADAVAQLHEWIKPGDTVRTILRHVSRSGMSRHISVVLIDGEGGDLHPNWSVAKACGFTLKRCGMCDAIAMGGCGTDMGFRLVYELSHALFRDGFGCIGKGCPSNDHSNGDRDYTPHEDHTGGNPTHICATSPESCTAKRHWHNDGGYALKQKWL